ncbi:MAG: flagellar hook capping protein [Planctomycetes bacterium]|nr:flagellar hook capping protein [Planctomycetota bacterium]
METPTIPQSAFITPEVQVVERDQTGFAALNADTFMKLLITELQNQDPLSPVESSDMLNQLAMMRNLSANIELADALKAITSDQQLSTAAAFIGKRVTGMDSNQNEVDGMVDRAFLRDNQAYVRVGDIDVPLSQVTSVNSV